MPIARPLISVAVLALIASCATVPFDAPKAESTAFTDTDDTWLGEGITALTRVRPGLSGFYPLSEGVEALAARLLLAERAERSLDVQYYFILPDLTGRLFLYSLYRAAERGVRVRLLIDDMHTKGHDPGLAALQTHPNIEIRIYNPFANRRARWLDFGFDLARVNQRMHNKSFTVDNVVTIVGGRNIGDEYFDARQEFQFGDLDLIGIGPVAPDVSAAFDDFWNSEGAVPVEAMLDTPMEADAAAGVGIRLRAVLEEVQGTPYAQALQGTVIRALEEGELPLFWAGAAVIYDSPNKIRGPTDDGVVSAAGELANIVEQAQREFLVVSPYFVPGDSGVEFLRGLRDRGVDITVITNSLAATDVTAVHSGYSKYRKVLLEMGVELWEVTAEPDKDRQSRSGVGYSRSSLHAKLYLVDRRYLYVGSFNWDPRSINLNTELGVFVDSPELAEQIATELEGAPERAYRLRLNDDGDIEWLRQTADGPQIHSREPETGFWRRFNAGFLRLLPIEGHL